MEPRLKELLERMTGSGTIRNMSASEGHELVEMILEMDNSTIVSCVYCGHEYPEGTPASKAETLTEHIKICEKHPMREAEETIVLLRTALVGLVGSDDKAELEQMEVFLRVSPAPMADKVSTIDAIHAIVKTMKAEPTTERDDGRWIMCGLCDTAYDPADTKEAAIHDHPEPQSGEPRDAWIASKMKYSEWIIKTEEGKAWSDRAIEKANLEEYKKRFIKYITDLGIELHMAQSELDGHLESNKDDLDMSDPEDDARECLTYWEE